MEYLRIVQFENGSEANNEQLSLNKKSSSEKIIGGAEQSITGK
jgi:hypothetical protein